MSAMTYRPGVYSSYTVTPSYTGAREALPGRSVCRKPT